MKKSIISISKVILSVATIPLWLVKIFVGVGHLPDKATGEIVKVIFRHSMFENVGDLIHPILAYIAIAIAVVSVVMNSIALKAHDSKGVKATANAVFWVTIGSFLIVLLLGSTVARGY